MTAFNESSQLTAAPPGTDYVGRTFFYLADPQAALDAGYDRIKVFKRANAADPDWVELTTETTAMVIRAGQVNYTFLDHKAKRGMQYRPSLADSTGVLPDVPQVNYVQDAVDTSYEAIISNQELRDLFMWGLLGLFQDDNGVQFPERLYTHYILYGIDKFEAKTRIRVRPTPVVEKHAYMPAAWAGRYWGFQLDEFPCVSIDQVSIKLPGQPEFVFPDSWLQKDLALGVVDIVPDTPSALNSLYPGFPGSGYSGPAFAKITPQAITVKYVAGFPLGRLPENIKAMIGKEAASGPLNIGGDLVGGAAIASQSMSMDGLSQSVNTTSSATNAGFGSRLIQYNQELKRDYPIIEKLYKGVRLYVG